MNITNVVSRKVAWLLRPLPHKINRLDEFKNKGIIAVGWPCIGNLYGKSRTQIKENLSVDPYNYVGSRLGQAASNLDLFVNRMEIGDLVVMPYKDDIYFGRITSDYNYNQEKDNDEDGYPHQRKVEWVTNKASRKKLSDDLRKSLRNRRTTAELSSHYYEIEEFGIDIK